MTMCRAGVDSFEVEVLTAPPMATVNTAAMAADPISVDVDIPPLTPG
jgi:hypothetical protein